MAKKTAAAVKGGKTAPKVKAGRKKNAAPKTVKSSVKAQPSYSYAAGVTVSEAYCLELVDGKLASVKVLADGTRQVMKRGSGELNLHSSVCSTPPASSIYWEVWGGSLCIHC
jgi:hypothetical protein